MGMREMEVRRDSNDGGDRGPEEYPWLLTSTRLGKTRSWGVVLAPDRASALSKRKLLRLVGWPLKASRLDLEMGDLVSEMDAFFSPPLTAIGFNDLEIEDFWETWKVECTRLLDGGFTFCTRELTAYLSRMILVGANRALMQMDVSEERRKRFWKEWIKNFAHLYTEAWDEYITEFAVRKGIEPSPFERAYIFAHLVVERATEVLQQISKKKKPHISEEARESFRQAYLYLERARQLAKELADPRDGSSMSMSMSESEELLDLLKRFLKDSLFALSMDEDLEQILK